VPLLTYYCYFLSANSMMLGPSWEANGSSASQEIPRVLWNLKAHYHLHNSPPAVRTWARFSPCPHPTSWRSILILTPIYAKIFVVVSFLQVFPPKYCMNLYCPLYLLHAPPNSLFFIWSPDWYLVGVQIVKLFFYAVFSIFSLYYIYSLVPLLMSSLIRGLSMPRILK
jgi:hypothetical protein